MNQNNALERVNDDLWTAPQLLPHLMADLAASGFRSIINNRPDGEGGPGQPTHAELNAAAAAAGLEYRHLPVPPSNHAEADARRMRELVDGLPKPVLAFCRTGRRARALYELGCVLAARG